jgi:hypothetical protein
VSLTARPYPWMNYRTNATYHILNYRGMATENPLLNFVAFLARLGSKTLFMSFRLDSQNC